MTPNNHPPSGGSETEGKMMSLTALQLLTLTNIANGVVSQRRFGYGAWRILGGNPSVVGRLISMGLAKWGPFDPDRKECLVTDLGRTILQERS